jgi:hypothetical protein
MRKFLFAFAAFALILSAQQGGGPKNLQVLKPADVRAAMGDATKGLGVTCAECHTAPDMSTDDKPAKLVARKMFAMTADINSKFPDGKVHVTCYTCHRGQKEPLTAPPAAQ